MCSEEKKPNQICKINENYDRLEIPAKEFHMNCSISVYDLVEINEVKHSITLYMNVKLMWYDKRLNVSNGTIQWVVHIVNSEVSG